MKKLTAILLTMILALSMTSTAFAAEITEGDGNPKSEEVTISASIAPTYTVTIPKDIQVEFNKTSTVFGTISLDKAQIDPGRAVKVGLTASGLLKKGTIQRPLPMPSMPAVRPSNPGNIPQPDRVRL